MQFASYSVPLKKASLLPYSTLVTQVGLLMLDQTTITIPKQPLTSYDPKQQWPPDFKVSEDGILTVTLAELASEKGSLCAEPSANPGLHPAYLSRLDSPSHLSTEGEAADTCHRTQRRAAVV